MIAICLAIYLFLGLVFIGSLALAASRPAPEHATVHANSNEIPAQFDSAEAPLRNAA